MSSFEIFNTNLQSKDSYHLEGFASNIHPTLATSWVRSSHYNINPYIESAPVKSQFTLNELEQLLLDSSLPYLKYFANIPGQSEFLLALSNKDGVLIQVEERPKFSKLAARHNFVAGAEWTEKTVGTNAVGTAIEERNNIYLSGLDHYSFGFSPYACAASPIFNLNNGEVLGVLDITGIGNELHFHSFGLVVAIARLIEKEINHQMGILQGNSMLGFNKFQPYRSGNGITIKCQNTTVEITGENSNFRSAFRDAEKAAKTNLSMLLTGETGTGKEVLARYIHYNSNRAQGPFIAVNCAAIPKDLVGSELFGYIDGAFTGASRRGQPGRFEQANGGTLFLDEIADAPMPVQVGLLRILEEKVSYRLGAAQGKPIDVRVLTATSQDLNTLIGKGLFREDLYYRLTGVIIDLPSLRERGQDIILLAEYFLNKCSTASFKNYVLEPNLKQIMLEYNWPGNIRELRNVVERMAALTESESLTSELFFRCIHSRKPFRLRKDSDKEVLICTLKQARGNITRVAEMLGIDRTTVYRRMKKYGLVNKEVL